jgi:hypothetical protein
MGRSLGKYRAAIPHRFRAGLISFRSHRPAIIEPNPEPRVVPRGVLLALVFVVMALALAIVEVLLRIEHGDDKQDQAAA